MSDRAEFVAFFEASWAGTFRRAYALTGDYQLAEDAAQSAYAKAYRSWPKVRAADDSAAYVRRMATNEVLTVWRRVSWRAEKLTDRVDRGGSPSHESDVVESDEVWNAVLSLPPRQRAIVVLRYYEDLSERDIAETLGIRPGSRGHLPAAGGGWGTSQGFRRARRATRAIANRRVRVGRGSTMNVEEKVRAAVKEHVDKVVPPAPDVEAVLGRGRGHHRLRIVAVPVAVVAIVVGVVAGVNVLNDGGPADSRPEPLGPLDYTHGMRAYASPDGDIFLGGRRFDGSDLESIDTDATATPYGMIYFGSGDQAYLLDEEGNREAIGPVPDTPPEPPKPAMKTYYFDAKGRPTDGRGPHTSKLKMAAESPDQFDPSAKADATRPLAAWTEYYGDHVTIRMYDLAAGEDVGSYDVPCSDGCADVSLDAVDHGLAYVGTADGAYVWDSTGHTAEWTRLGGPKTEIVGVHAKTILYSGAAPAPAPGGPVDDSWTLVKGAVDAELSHDGRYVLYWSSKLKPVRPGDDPIRLALPHGAGFYTFDTDGSLLAATYGNPAKVYDCELPSGACTRLDDMTTRSGDPVFIGNDM